MTCTCTPNTCRLPTRCQRDERKFVAQPIINTPLQRWENITESLIADIEWVMPQTAAILRSHLKCRPEEGAR